MDQNLNYFTRYQNQEVADLVAQGRVELDPEKRREIYYEIQRISKDDVHWIDLYYSPFRNISRANVHDFSRVRSAGSCSRPPQSSSRGDGL